jgi:hypothetical protein
MVERLDLGERQVMNVPDALASAPEFGLCDHLLLRSTLGVEPSLQAARPARGDLGSQEVLGRDTAPLEHESSTHQAFGVRQHLSTLLEPLR